MRTALCFFGLIATISAHPGHELTAHGPAHVGFHVLGWMIAAAVIGCVALIPLARRRLRARARA